MPNASSSTFTIGARQFVVQDAFERILNSGFKTSSLTPKTMIASRSSLGGAVKITFLAPALI